VIAAVPVLVGAGAGEQLVTTANDAVTTAAVNPTASRLAARCILVLATEKPMR